MKKILLLLFVLLLVFVSCSDDDDEETGISGTWIEISATPKEIIASDTETEEKIKEAISNYGTDKYVFTSDKFTYYENGSMVDWEGKYSVSGSSITLTDDDYSETYTNFSVKGNNMSFDHDATDNFKFLYDKVSKVIVSYSYKRQ